MSGAVGRKAAAAGRDGRQGVMGAGGGRRQRRRGRRRCVPLCACRYVVITALLTLFQSVHAPSLREQNFESACFAFNCGEACSMQGMQAIYVQTMYRRDHIQAAGGTGRRHVAAAMAGQAADAASVTSSPFSPPHALLQWCSYQRLSPVFHQCSTET